MKRTFPASYEASQSLPPLAGTFLWLNYGLISSHAKISASSRSCCFSILSKSWEISQFSCTFILGGFVFFHVSSSSFFFCLRDWGTMEKKETFKRSEKSIRNETARKKEMEEKHKSASWRWQRWGFLITLFSALNDNFLLRTPSPLSLLPSMKISQRAEREIFIPVCILLRSLAKWNNKKAIY